MSLLGHSLLDTQSLDEGDVFSIFETAQKIRQLHQENKVDYRNLLEQNAGKYLALVFLEPSTRTRASFEVAAHRVGLRTVCPEFGGSSSRSKGETLVDTVKTIAAMQPSAIVVRSSDSEELMSYLRESEIPILNGGAGITGHPTQALLDSFTIHESLGEVKGQKVLLVGDVQHSRVARSNIELLQKLGAEVAFCGPDAFQPNDLELPRYSIEEGIEWASVVMALRIQLERHNEKGTMTNEDFHRDYGVTVQRLKKLGDGIFMHPGPMNQGVEVESAVLSDPRCRVLTQVNNGVHIRAAVLSQVLGIRV